MDWMGWAVEGGWKAGGRRVSVCPFSRTAPLLAHTAPRPSSRACAPLRARMRAQLQTVLKLQGDKWDDVLRHTRSAVEPDVAPRCWWCPVEQMGLMFACKAGAPELKIPTGGPLPRFGLARSGGGDQGGGGGGAEPPEGVTNHTRPPPPPPPAPR
jgi:hypothetical protein